MTVQRAIPRVSQLQDVQGCGFSGGYARRHVHLRGKEEANRKCNGRRRTRDLVPGTHRSLFLKIIPDSKEAGGPFVPSFGKNRQSARRTFSTPRVFVIAAGQKTLREPSNEWNYLSRRTHRRGWRNSVVSGIALIGGGGLRTARSHLSRSAAGSTASSFNALTQRRSASRPSKRNGLMPSAISAGGDPARGRLAGVSRATVPREAGRTRRACGIRIP